MNWTKKQIEFLTAAEMGRSIYLSGKAGTGKSTVAIELMERFRKAKIKFIAVAPTGRAATNIEGETIHSMFRIDPHKIVKDPEECNFINKAKMQVLRNAKVIFIDEGSMCRSDLVMSMHYTLIKNGVAKGLKGKQTIWIGDMKQLPPIASDNERSILLELYEGITLFDAPIMKDISLLQIDLDEVVRQSDIEFIESLNIVRDGGKAGYFRQFVTKEPHGVILAAKNETVNRYNEEGLSGLQGKEYIFDAVYEGNVKTTDFNFDARVKVKNGAKIMYLVNSKDNPLRNGTLGELVIKENPNLTIVTDPDNPKPYVELFFKYNSTEWPIELYTAKKQEYVYNKEKDEFELKDKGSITQYPIRLAYAITIHKAQGMTFDKMTADLRGAFMREQYYVALSRATGPQALKIII
jgi:ATP-dependent exoDNAse (exonuclease V) alpha subunit